MITCIFDGKPMKLRHVTVDGIVVRDNKLLLVKRSATDYIQPNKYAFPGGYLDRDELASEGVLREVQEETGYQGLSAELFYMNDNPFRKVGETQNISFFFLVTVGEKTSDHDHEVSDVQWFDLEELPAEVELAFDHYEVIKLYLEHLKNPRSLPLLYSKK